jgi:hypothetical protein
MKVRELECPACAITVRGDFGAAGTIRSGNRFDTLNADQMAFLETFLSCRGIIRDVEAALGISYPTVRARLDGLLVALGFNGSASEKQSGAEDAGGASAEKPALKDILSRLDAGMIDAKSALDAIRGASKGDGK